MDEALSSGWTLAHQKRLRVVSMIVMTYAKSVRGGCGNYDVTPYIFLILSLTFTPNP